MSLQSIGIRCGRTDRLWRVERRKQRLNLRIEGIQDVDGIQTGRQPRTLVSHIGDTQEDVLRKLPFNGQVPLLGIGPPVGIQWAIKNTVAVVEGPRDKWRKLLGCRNSVVQVKCGIVLVRRRVFKLAERLIQVQPVERDPPAPAGVERLREENAITCSDDGLLVLGIRHAQPRRKAPAPGLFRVLCSVTSRLASRAASSKGQAPWYPVRIRTCGIEERKMIEFLTGWREVIPPHAEIRGEFCSHLPGVVEVQRPGILAREPGAYRSAIHRTAVYCS